jgi:hypothetical protein
MPATRPPIYDELVDLLLESADAARVLAFRLSPHAQSRVEHLLEKNRQGSLTTDESAELDEIERFEHVVRVLKARLLEKGSQGHVR